MDQRPEQPLFGGPHRAGGHGRQGRRLDAALGGGLANLVSDDGFGHLGLMGQPVGKLIAFGRVRNRRGDPEHGVEKGLARFGPRQVQALGRTVEQKVQIRTGSREPIRVRASARLPDVGIRISAGGHQGDVHLKSLADQDLR